ncbi:MAG: GGDEF domain-containing protein [Acidimicrobiales bacterium]
MERHLERLDERHGTRGVVAAITAVSLVLAELLTVASSLATRTPTDFIVIGMLIAGVVTLSVAPLSSYLIARLLHDLAGAHRELHALAFRDGLTGLSNRRSFFAEAETLLAEAGPSAPAVAVMIDLDRFKQLNDTHGHAAGDAALVALAGRLAGVVGGDGIVARLGGDEFAAVLRLPRERHGERIEALHRACTAVPARPGVVVDGSLGTYAVPTGMGLEDALHLADVALYRAKAERKRQHGAGPLATSARHEPNVTGARP